MNEEKRQYMQKFDLMLDKQKEIREKDANLYKQVSDSREQLQTTLQEKDQELSTKNQQIANML